MVKINLLLRVVFVRGTRQKAINEVIKERVIV